MSSLIDSTAQPPRSRLKYWTLLSTEAVGVILLYAQLLPQYRALVNERILHESVQQVWLWPILAIALVQGTYWTRPRMSPEELNYRNIVLGHVVLFLGRLSFVVATSVYSFVFIGKQLEATMSPARYVLMLVGVFSLYCFTLDLERLGGALNRKK